MKLKPFFLFVSFLQEKNPFIARFNGKSPALNRSLLFFFHNRLYYQSSVISMEDVAQIIIFFFFDKEKPLKIN